MATNSPIILEEIVKQRMADSGATISFSDYFEVFCAEEILKDYDLTNDDIELGIVDGEHDGGIDSVYAFINGNLVYEDFDATPYKKDISFDLHIIQSKSKNGFSESSIDKLIASCGKLLKLDADYDQLTQFNAEVKNVFGTARTALRKVLGKMPSVSITYHLAAAAAGSQISTNLQKKAQDLVEITNDLFPQAEVAFNFLAADELIAAAQRQKKTTYEVNAEKAIRDGDAFVALIELRNYYEFLSEGGLWKDDLFEENVRDDQGGTTVNDEIQATLIAEDKLDFWIMNNGITVLSSKVVYNEPNFQIENPQIVNGLQTSRQVFNYYSETNPLTIIGKLWSR